MTEGVMIGTRTSIYKDPEFFKAHNMPKAWIDAVAEALANPVPELPEVRDVSQYRDIYGVALANIVGGADARTELEKATREFEPIFQKGLRM